MGVCICWFGSSTCLLIFFESMHSNSLRFVHACMPSIVFLKQWKEASRFKCDRELFGSCFNFVFLFIIELLMLQQTYLMNNAWGGFQDIWMHVRTIKLQLGIACFKKSPFAAATWSHEVTRCDCRICNT